MLRPEETDIGGEALLEFEKALQALVRGLWTDDASGRRPVRTPLRSRTKQSGKVFWRGVLEKELTLRWFQKAPDDLKKQFNLRTHEELMDTPSAPSRVS